MKRLTLASPIAACICLGLSAPVFAAEAGTVNNPSAVDNNVSATKPVPIADVPGWRQQQIAAAQPVTSRNTPFTTRRLLRHRGT